MAAVQGYCIFGGWMIASAMDVIFAADDAMLLGSHFQYFAMPWDLHPGKVKEILFESRFIDATEAHELGLVNRVMPRARLAQAAHAMYTLGRLGERDPDGFVQETGEKRRPMVGVPLENYRRHRDP